MRIVMGLSTHKQITRVHQTASTRVHSAPFLWKPENLSWSRWRGRSLPWQFTSPLSRIPASRTSAAPNPVDSYLSSLDAEQEAAAKSTCNVVRVKAGPGSGKTRVIIARVAWLIDQCGVSPHDILTITFTRKAAEELKERLSGLLGRRGERVRAGTFHAICSKILRDHVERLNCGLTRKFSVKDDDEAEDIMQKVIIDSPALQACKLDSKEKGQVAEWLASQVKDLKNHWDTVHEVEDVGQEWAWHPNPRPDQWGRVPDPRVTLNKQEVNSVFVKYHRRLRAINAVDFADLLGLTVYLLEQCPDILGFYRWRYKHILVDEFQDTNSPQYALVRLLRGGHNNLFVVGDTHQAIYGWRGANRHIMETRLPNQYPHNQLLFLNNNYRSARQIVEASSAVLSHGGLPTLYKPMQPMRGDGEYVYTVECRNCDEEAEWVANRARQLVHKEGYQPSDIAVLYRTKWMSKKPEAALMAAGFRTRVVGDIDFWERAAVKDMLAYLTWALNPHDNMALERVVAKPARGIGNAYLDTLTEVATIERMTWAALIFGDLEKECLTLDQLHKAMAGDMSVFNIISAADITKRHGVKLSNKALESLDSLRRLLVILRSCACHRNVENMIDVVLTKAGYATYLEAKKKEAQGMEHVHVLRNIAANTAAWLQQEDDASDTDISEEGSSSAGSSADDGLSATTGLNATQVDDLHASVLNTGSSAASTSSMVAQSPVSADDAGDDGSSRTADMQSSTQAASTSNAPAGSMPLRSTAASNSTPLAAITQSSRANSPGAFSSVDPDPTSADDSLAQGLDRLSQFLQHVKLVNEKEQGKREDTEAVQLMTAHSSKGLEFKAVFILGLEDGSMPSRPSEASDEEKRVAYVACTRAEDQLYLMYTQQRQIYGTYTACPQSRYLATLRAVAPNVLKHISHANP